MTLTAIEVADGTTTVDPRMAAFLAPTGLEIFHSVATPNGIWQADPYDVESIHADARLAFERLLQRGSQLRPPPSGAVLVLLGEAGSGKTHLMRAFRTRAHSQGLGYCAYLQMTTEAGNYAKYMLQHLIDGLEQPYAPEGPTRTGLARLSAALLEEVPGLTAKDRESFREGDANVTKLVDEFADRIHATSRFRSCDLELIRVMLHLQRSSEPQVHSRALMWLRCQDMRPQDREWIGDALTRNDDADPMRMLQQFARFIDAVHGVPLVLLIDQLEDMANQSAPTERFLKIVDAVTAFTDQIPNAVAVLACLEDYFSINKDKLSKAKQDRLIRDPEPIRLLGNRTFEEIQAMTCRRLVHLYDTVGTEAASDELYPFREAHLKPLNGMRTRDALDFLRRHHNLCIANGRWQDPEATPSERPVGGAPPPSETSDLEQLWNDFHSGFSKSVPDEEPELADILGNAIQATTGELPDGFHFGCGQPDDRYLEVETHKPDNSVSKLLVAVCNAKPGNNLSKQLTALEQRAGEIPVALIRTTDSPKSGKAYEQITALLKRGGRRIVVENADWRRMQAFGAFRQLHATRPGFADWQKAARPLGELDSLQKILRLNELKPHEFQPPFPVRTGPLTAPAPKPVPTLSTPPNASPIQVTSDAIVLGRTQNLAPTPVLFKPVDFTRHAAFLGGSGSGKTTAALNLIEQLLIRDIPAVLLDRKGDLCRYADLAPNQASSPVAGRERF